MMLASMMRLILVSFGLLRLGRLVGLVFFHLGLLHLGGLDAILLSNRDHILVVHLTRLLLLGMARSMRHFGGLVDGLLLGVLGSVSELLFLVDGLVVALRNVLEMDSMLLNGLRRLGALLGLLGRLVLMRGLLMLLLLLLLLMMLLMLLSMLLMLLLLLRLLTRLLSGLVLRLVVELSFDLFDGFRGISKFLEGILDSLFHFRRHLGSGLLLLSSLLGLHRLEGLLVRTSGRRHIRELTKAVIDELGLLNSVDLSRLVSGGDAPFSVLLLSGVLLGALISSTLFRHLLLVVLLSSFSSSSTRLIVLLGLLKVLFVLLGVLGRILSGTLGRSLLDARLNSTAGMSGSRDDLGPDDAGLGFRAVLQRALGGSLFIFRFVQLVSVGVINLKQATLVTLRLELLSRIRGFRSALEHGGSVRGGLFVVLVCERVPDVVLRGLEV